MNWDELLRLFATLLQAISIAVTAFFAVRGLKSWRQQLVGKRRFEVAEESILVFIRAAEAIRYARNGFAGNDEGKSRPRLRHEPDQATDTRDTYFVPVKRLRDSDEQFVAARKQQIICGIHFGAPGREPFDALFKAMKDVAIASQLLVETAGEPRSTQEARDRHSKWLDAIWAPNSAENKIGAALDAAFDRLLSVLKPNLS